MLNVPYSAGMSRPEYSEDFRHLVATEAQSSGEITKVANKFKVAPNTVRIWMNRLASTGSVATKKRSGRPSTLGVEERKYCKRQLLRGKSTCKSIASKLTIKGKDISPTTVWRTATSGKNGLKLKSVRMKPFLTAQHKANRVAFARANRGTDWSKVIFTDSKYWIY